MNKRNLIKLLALSPFGLAISKESNEITVESVENYLLNKGFKNDKDHSFQIALRFSFNKISRGLDQFKSEFVDWSKPNAWQFRCATINVLANKFSVEIIQDKVLVNFFFINEIFLPSRAFESHDPICGIRLSKEMTDAFYKAEGISMPTL